MKSYFVLLLSAALAAAAPATTIDIKLPINGTIVSTEALSRRTQGNVFVCVNINFGAPCAVFHGSSGQCVNFTPAFNDDITSFGPDSDQDCFIFSDINCGGQQAGPIRNPGIADLSTLGLNDVISSFKCFFG